MWQPTASLVNLQKRAAIITSIRAFFAERQVLEVETPLLSHATVTDPYVIGIPAQFRSHGGHEQTVYLQTSPEYAMKRLLAAGAGPIYQISKAFRQGDLGSLHNPEFTMLEWYRPGFDHHALMDEMDALLQPILLTPLAERLSYADAFEKYVAINPHDATVEQLAMCAKQKISYQGDGLDRNGWLDLLLTHCIEPYLGEKQPVFLYDFPVSQAALARIDYTKTPAVASRFEVYYHGIELANGFHELQDPAEQRNRFENDLCYRAKNNLQTVPLDERFLAALAYGLPNCAGVALGIDRLVMLALQQNSLMDVLSFSFIHA